MNGLLPKGGSEGDFLTLLQLLAKDKTKAEQTENTIP